MLESDQQGSHTIVPPAQGTSSPSTQVPTWLTAASAVAHTFRITHIPGLKDIDQDSTAASSGKLDDGHLDDDHQLSDSDQTLDLASAYYDAAAMAPLNPFSKVCETRAHASFANRISLAPSLAPSRPRAQPTALHPMQAGHLQL